MRLTLPQVKQIDASKLSHVEPMLSLFVADDELLIYGLAAFVKV